MNTNVQNFAIWMATEEKIQSEINGGDIMFLEELFYDIIETATFNFALVTGDETVIDSDSDTGREVTRVIDRIVSSKTNKDGYIKGSLLEDMFYNSAVKVFGETNVQKGSRMDDFFGSTDFFIYGFRIDVTAKYEAVYAIAKDFYYAEEDGLKMKTLLLNRNARREYSFPVLSLVFEGYYTPEKMDKLLQDHMSKLLLEFNRLCHVLNYC